MTNIRSGGRAGHRRPPSATAFRRGWRWVLVGAILLAGLSFIIRARTTPEEVRTIFVPALPPLTTAVDTLHGGQTLAELLSARGFAAAEIYAIVTEIRGFVSPRRLRPGVVVGFAWRGSDAITRLRVQPDRDRVLYLTALEGGGWSGRLDSVSVTVDTLRIGGTIRTSVYDASVVGDVQKLAPNEQADIVYELSRLFAWEIDFHRDLRENDGFRVAIQREVRPDGTVRSGAQVLIAEFMNQGRLYTAVRFVTPEGGVEYYDRDGNSLQRMFLRAPLAFPRVTSRFSSNRFHPVLHLFRAHLGIDYHAPTGTPVLATGSGTVTRAGLWGGYGRMVEIRHNGTYTTRYAHLSRLGKGIGVGTRVRQGEVIGYSGSTGLANAPHLHYEFLRNGRQINPAALKLPPSRAVAPALRARFEAQRNEALPLIEDLAVPGTFDEPQRMAGLAAPLGTPAE